MYETRQFENRYTEEPAFVIGNGPSLKNMNLDRIAGKVSFGSNAISLIFDETNWRPTVYSCIDSVVLVDRLKDIQIMRMELPEMQFFFPKHLFDDSEPPKPIAVQQLLPPTPNTTYFDSVPCQFTDNAFTAFSPDLGKYLIHGTTVTTTLIQLAVLMGCNPIYLIGCDTNYTIPQNAKELNPDADRVDKTLVLDADNDPNHFDPNYFGKGKKWHTPNPHLMIAQYQKVKEACDHLGFQIYNATIGGKLEVFPRVSFDSLF
jgi:hypothetical protein